MPTTCSRTARCPRAGSLLPWRASTLHDGGLTCRSAGWSGGRACHARGRTTAARRHAWVTPSGEDGFATAGTPAGGRDVMTSDQRRREWGLPDVASSRSTTPLPETRTCWRVLMPSRWWNGPTRSTCSSKAARARPTTRPLLNGGGDVGPGGVNARGWGRAARGRFVKLKRNRGSIPEPVCTAFRGAMPASAPEVLQAAAGMSGEVEDLTAADRPTTFALALRDLVGGGEGLTVLAKPPSPTPSPGSITSTGPSSPGPTSSGSSASPRSALPDSCRPSGRDDRQPTDPVPDKAPAAAQEAPGSGHVPRRGGDTRAWSPSLRGSG